MKQNTNDARTSGRLPDLKHTYSGRTDIYCADEATRRRGRYRQKSVRRASRALPPDLSFRFCIRRQLYVSVRLPFPPLVAIFGVLSCVAQPAPLCLVPVPPRHETVRRFDDPPVPLPALLSRPRSEHRLYSEQQRNFFRGPIGGLKNPEVVC